MREVFFTICWQAKKIKYVAKSTLAAEISCVETAETCF